MKYRKNIKYTKEILESACQDIKSYAEILRNLDLPATGGNYRHIKMLLNHYEISLPNSYKGRSWNKGLTAETNSSIKKGAAKISIPWEDIFVENSRSIKSSKLRKGMLEYAGIEYKCSSSVCTIISEWYGSPLKLQIDHKNGNPSDNRLENLRFLCPNCHTQTPTWGR